MIGLADNNAVVRFRPATYMQIRLYALLVLLA